MSSLFFVTSNNMKFEIARRSLQNSEILLQQCQLQIDEIQDFDSKKISIQSAITAYNILKAPLVVADTSFHITAMNDFPGPFVKYINKYLQPKDILSLLSDNRNREIRIIEYATIISQKGYKCFSSVCNGLIGMQVSPNPGTSFERVVVPEGFQSPLADLSMEAQLDYWVAHSVFNNIETRNYIRTLG